MRLLTSPYPQQNGRVSAPLERFTLVNGVPQTIALQYINGKRVASRISGAADQMMYTLSDGRRAYFPLEVGAEIDSLHLAPGELFVICKFGPRDWSIERAAVEIPQHPPQPRPQPPSQPRPQQQPAYPPAAQAAPQQQRMNGAGQTAAEILAGYYPDAVAIALSAVEIARAKGLMIAPAFEDIRSIATTLFIEGSRNER